MPETNPLHRVTLAGGPLDGESVDIQGWPDQDIAVAVALPAPGGRWPGGRSHYGPQDGRTDVWVWQGDTA